VKPLSGKELSRMLESHGWSLQRINGSHHIYASIPIHGNESLKRGLPSHLMKLAGLLP
jgi:predicted RNA binding protein YcfA (HicA-like mRNA interferase family)